VSGAPTDVGVVVVGAGLVGLATARALQRRADTGPVLVVDKEAGPARHQSGRNSGVAHSGLYYAPGSRKAALAVAGRAALERYCEDRSIPYRACGKVVVAVDDSQLPALAELERRGRANGVRVERVDPAGLRRIEPHARGVAALHVADTGVVDFPAVARSLVEDLRSAGGALRGGLELARATPVDGSLEVEFTDGSRLRAGALVNCAGLQSDRVALRCGARPAVRIVPFRGDYLDVAAPSDELVRSLIYPVPDDRWPFLGVHLTRSVDGQVHAGPTAVLAFGREAYDRSVDRHDTVDLLRQRALWRLGLRYWRTGLSELRRARSRDAVVADLRRLVPELDGSSLRPARPGIRAQAISADGRLVDDFAFATSPRCVHVLNAPSPAATASLAIGDHVAARVVTVTNS
jgi:L-2-hydroxyglutarate oxidase